jgi:hypothetical protein
MDQLTFLSEEPLVSHSQSQDLEKDWTMTVVTYRSNSLNLLNENAHDGWFGRTSPASCLVTEEKTLAPSSGRWGKSGMGSHTEFLTLNTSEWPKDADVCLLSDTLETGDVPQRFYLSAKACAGILRRAERKGEKPAPTVTAGPPFSRTGNDRVECDAYVSQIVGPLTRASNAGGTVTHQDISAQHLVTARMRGFGDYDCDGTASTVKARDYKDATDLVAFALAENTIGRKPMNGGNGDGFTEGGPMYTLNATGVHGVAHQLAIPINTMTVQGRPSDDLNPRMGLGIGEPGDPCPTITSAHSHAVAAVQYKATGESSLSDVTMSITASYGAGGADLATKPLVCGMAVRRLTPTECERLQGFPDGYTNIKDKCPDGPRYKALGNSMAVPVMKWIGERIQMVENYE